MSNPTGSIFGPNNVAAPASTASQVVDNYTPTITTPQAAIPALSNASLAGSGINPLTPDQVAANYAGAYQSATSGYAPFTGGGQTHDDINQFQSVYNQIPGAFDVSGTLASMDAARQASLTTGTEAANTAAQKFQTSNIPGAATGVGSSVIRAQSLLPYLNQDFTNAASEGQYANSASQNALTTAAGVANSIAGLQQNYTNSLAAYNSQKANFGNNYAQGLTGAQQSSSNSLTSAQLGLLQSQLSSQTSLSQAQLAAGEQSATSLLGAQTSLTQNAQNVSEQAREANLSASLQSQTLATQNKQTSQNQAITAANDLLTNNKAIEGGSWTTNNQGQVNSGQSDYNAYQSYLAGKSSAVNLLSQDTKTPAF